MGAWQIRLDDKAGSGRFVWARTGSAGSIDARLSQRLGRWWRAAGKSFRSAIAECQRTRKLARKTSRRAGGVRRGGGSLVVSGSDAGDNNEWVGGSDELAEVGIRYEATVLERTASSRVGPAGAGPAIRLDSERRCRVRTASVPVTQMRQSACCRTLKGAIVR